MSDRGKALFLAYLVAFCLLAFSSVKVNAQGWLPPIYFGPDLQPLNVNPANVDITYVNYTNNGWQFQFQIGLLGSVSFSQGQTYYVYMDTITGQGAPANNPTTSSLGADYYIVFNSNGALLYQWSGTVWSLSGFTITYDYTSLANTLYLTGDLSAIGYPWSNTNQGMCFIVATTVGQQNEKDTSPDPNGGTNGGNCWLLTYFQVPDLPWPVLPIFSLAVVATISLLYKYKFQPKREALCGFLDFKLKNNHKIAPITSKTSAPGSFL